MGTRTAVFGLALVSLLSGCGFRPQLTPQGDAAHQVRYLVRCEACRVAFTVSGDAMNEAAVKGMWTKTVNIRTSVTGSVILTATPTSSASLVSHAYIEVDGRTVAETRRTTKATFIDEVTLTARLSGS